VIESHQAVEFGTIGISLPSNPKKRNSEDVCAKVYTLNHRGLACCVSDYPSDQMIPATRENCLAHERVLEEIMKGFTLLPFEFGTVSPSQEGVVALLSKNSVRIKLALRRLHGKVEVSVKAFWPDLTQVCQGVARDHPVIAKYKEEIASKPLEMTYKDRIVIGEMVASALNELRKKEGKAILTALRKVSEDEDEEMLYAETMVMKASFLVKKKEFTRFEAAINQLGKQYDGRINFKYAGPLPPYHFTKVSLEGM
jgi:hypothetical protein